MQYQSCQTFEGLEHIANQHFIFGISIVNTVTADLTTDSRIHYAVIMMTTAFSYRRFSSLKQETGSSLDRQLELAKEICEEKGWKLADLPPDAGISGFKGANIHTGALGIFLKKVLAKQIPIPCILILEKMDRFSRNEVDLVIPDFLKLLQNGVEIFTCSDRGHYTLADIRSNPMLLQFAIMTMAMANDFSKSLSKRLKKTWQVNAGKALKGETVNFGNWQPRWINFTKDGFKLNEKAEVIKGIVKEYLKGQSMVKIASRLNREHTPNIGQRGHVWTQGSIHYVLKTDALIGNLHLQGIDIDGYWPAVIDKKEWNGLQSLLSQNKNKKGGLRENANIANLFPNRCFCSCCKGAVGTMKSPKFKKHPYYYKCHNARRDKCEIRNMVPVDLIELDFFGKYLRQTPGEILRQQTPEQDNKIAELRTKISSLDTQIQSISDLLGEVSIPEVKIKLMKMVEERQTLKIELDRMSTSVLTSSDAPMALKEMEMFYAALLIKKDSIQEKIKERIEQHLQRQSTRAKMISLISAIISHLVIDLEKRRYAVVSHSGVQSNWRNI